MQSQAEGKLTEDFIIPVPSITAAPEEYPLASFQCTLRFISKELDPSTGEPEAEGYEDEYQLEEVELSAGSDYIIPNYATFASEWDRLRTGPNATETFALSAMESLQGAIFHITASTSRY
jgi:coatomer protein complex subunit gamma